MKPHIVYLVTEDWYFYLHRYQLALAAKEAGYRVSVVTRVHSHDAIMESGGLNIVPFPWNRRSMNLLTESRMIPKLRAIYRELKPDILHHIALKPALYGSIAARTAGEAAIVNNLPGLGSIFTVARPANRLLRTCLIAAIRRIFSASQARTLVENADDRSYLVQAARLAPERVELIRGVGVDPELFYPKPEPKGEPVVTMASRMLWDKGINELITATKALKERGVKFRLVLVGKPDEENPSAIPEKLLREWHEQKVAEWWGFQEDMPSVWQSSHIAVLPSNYGEGLPRSLLEAASCARPLITTDMPGCREIVEHGKNGFLIPPRDPAALADAMAALIGDANLRRWMGQHSRTLVEQNFTLSRSIEHTLSLYRRMLDTVANA